MNPALAQERADERLVERFLDRADRGEYEMDIPIPPVPIIFGNRLYGYRKGNRRDLPRRRAHVDASRESWVWVCRCDPEGRLPSMPTVLLRRFDYAERADDWPAGRVSVFVGRCEACGTILWDVVRVG